MFAFQVAENIPPPFTGMLKSVFLPVLYSGEVGKLPARWCEC